METAMSYILTAVITIVSGLVLFFLQRMLNKQQKAEEERDQKKAQENALILRSINALGNLTVAN